MQGELVLILQLDVERWHDLGSVMLVSEFRSEECIGLELRVVPLFSFSKFIPLTALTR